MKTLTIDELTIGTVYRVLFTNGKTQFFTFMGGDCIMLLDGSFSFLEETDKIIPSPYTELYLKICLN